MNVLIVGRTKMGNTSRCIGGIARDGSSVRLLNGSGRNWETSTLFQVGQIWDVAYTTAATTVPPHTEDVLVSQSQLIGSERNLRDHLLARLQPWRGISQMFGGVLGFTSNNSGFVCQRLGVPAHSTGFWIPDRDLTLRADERHYDYFDGDVPRGLSYVGEPEPLPTLPAGTLVRVSLARWWKPDNSEPDFEERCYLQLSGWFL